MHRTLLCGLVSLTLTAPSVAEDATYDTAIPLKIPRKKAPRQGGPLDKVELRMWIPGDVEIIRGAIVNPYYVDAVGQKHWQEAARLWGFGIIGGNYFDVKSDDFPTILLALKEFAKQSGHAEIEHLPFCFVGMSAGAGMSMKMADLLPDRTIACGPVCLEVGPRSPATRKIPTITVFGQKDGKQYEKLTTKLPEERAEGAQWAIAVQWGRRHEFGQANNIVMPFFDAVIKERYPAEMNPKNGFVELKEYPDSAVWLGDLSTWEQTEPKIYPADKYSSDKSKAVWLPGKTVAVTWSAFVAKEKRFRLKAPAGLGDGQAFETHSIGEIPAETSPIGKAQLTKSQLMDGENGIVTIDQGESLKFTIPNLEPGIHPLIMAGIFDDGSSGCSRPHTVIVRRR